LIPAPACVFRRTGELCAGNSRMLAALYVTQTSLRGGKVALYHVGDMPLTRDWCPHRDGRRWATVLGQTQGALIDSNDQIDTRSGVIHRVLGAIRSVHFATHHHVHAIRCHSRSVICPQQGGQQRRGHRHTGTSPNICNVLDHEFRLLQPTTSVNGHFCTTTPAAQRLHGQRGADGVTTCALGRLNHAAGSLACGCRSRPCMTCTSHRDL
jgi:hypothetical protein